jgi:hypothetical protein
MTCDSAVEARAVEADASAMQCFSVLPPGEITNLPDKDLPVTPVRLPQAYKEAKPAQPYCGLGDLTLESDLTQYLSIPIRIQNWWKDSGYVEPFTAAKFKDGKAWARTKLGDKSFKDWKTGELYAKAKLCKLKRRGMVKGHVFGLLCAFLPALVTFPDAGVADNASGSAAPSCFGLSEDARLLELIKTPDVLPAFQVLLGKMSREMLDSKETRDKAGAWKKIANKYNDILFQPDCNRKFADDPNTAGKQRSTLPNRQPNIHMHSGCILVTMLNC